MTFFNAPEDFIDEPEPLSFPNLSPLCSPADDSTFHFTHLHDDEDLEHLDFNCEDQLSSFCRERLNHVTARTLTVLLMEMRRIDTEIGMILLQKTSDRKVILSKDQGQKELKKTNVIFSQKQVML